MSHVITPASGFGKRHTRGLIGLVRAILGLLIVVLFAVNLSVLLHIRDSTIEDTRIDLKNLALALAGQTGQALHGVDLVLNSLAADIVAKGGTTSTAFGRIVSAPAMNDALRAHVIGLPQVDALLAFGADGTVTGGTTTWPAAAPELISHDDYEAFLNNPDRISFLTPPFRSQFDGKWVMMLLRKVQDTEKRPIALLAAVMDLHHFHRLHQAIAGEDDRTISLLREDGTQLSHYPLVDTTGRAFSGLDRILRGADSGTIREPSPYDGRMRIKAAWRVQSWPLVVLVTLGENGVLKDWWELVGILSAATLGCCLALIIAVIAVERQWRQQDALAEERESRFVAEAALIRERERSAENESRARSGFLAAMSHEIRTPMNGVLGLAGSLLDTALSGRQRKMVEAIRDSGDSLLRILNDILDFSKLDAGQMQLEETPFSPATLTQNPVSLLGPRAIAKGLTIEALCDDFLPAALLGDPGRIRQVLLNLVSNAIKFTESGSVTIHAACFARDERAATIAWTVTDTGIGIAPDRIGGLFGEFVQADASITRRFGGSGLGLAISKRLIEQMGGTIAVESRPNQGSTFRVALRLPITEPAGEEAPPTPDVAAAFESRLKQLGRPARILFAEDNPTNQFVALQLLRGFNVQTDVVADGLEAVHAASSFLYDVICMDMRMPEMDGLAATRAIRERGGHLATLPIIALTANAFPEDVAACFDAGMTAFIAKPVRKDTLLSALLSALGQASAAPVMTTPAPEETRAEAALDRPGFARLAQEIGEEGVVELVAMFERETRDRLALLATPDLDRIVATREMHSLKGAAASACAEALFTRAADLEAGLTRGAILQELELAGLAEAFEAWLRVVRRPSTAMAA